MDENGGVPLKDGDRPLTSREENGEAIQFEDQYEDEFEEDDVMVAGEDGQPDDEREAEDGAGM